MLFTVHKIHAEGVSVVILTPTWLKEALITCITPTLTTQVEGDKHPSQTVLNVSN